MDAHHTCTERSEVMNENGAPASYPRVRGDQPARCWRSIFEGAAYGSQPSHELQYNLPVLIFRSLWFYYPNFTRHLRMDGTDILKGGGFFKSKAGTGSLP